MNRREKLLGVFMLFIIVILVLVYIPVVTAVTGVYILCFSLVIFIVGVIIAGNKDSKEYTEKLLIWYDKMKDQPLEVLVNNPHLIEGHLDGLNLVHIRYALRKRAERDA